MADNPPPYEEKYSGGSNGHKDEGKKAANRPYNLSDQASASRSILVSAAADKILAALEQRALYGISRTRLVVMPAGHGCNLTGPYTIADFDEQPTVMELDGELNSVEFWSQARAITELRRQVASRIGGGRQNMLDVGAVQLHVRYETPFGLYDTMDVMAIVVEMR